MEAMKQALREAAEKATKGPYVVGHHNINQHGNLNGVYVCQQWKDSAGGVVAECHVNCLTKTSEQVYANAEFIAVANPATMLALLDENLQLQREKDATEAVALALRDDMRQAREQLAAAEKRNAELREYYEGVIADGSKRIAELEAKLSKPVLLPKTNGYWNEQEKAYEEAITLARRQIRLAGFRCEGDE
ncbi:ead/Ea22-like family protein [Salmonella enterica subsp. enterica serovar Newport]|nr:ead/Ea22-like family protein [Salmonella enterica subsp. enterica serovar Newport]